MAELYERDLCRLIDDLGDNASEVKELTERVKNALYNISENLEMGLLRAHFVLPRGNVIAEDERDIVFYRDVDGYEEEGAYAETYTIGEGEKTTLTAYPKKGVTWEEKDKAKIHHLERLFFILIGRTRMLSLLDQAVNYDTMTKVYNQSGLNAYAWRLFAKDVLAEYNAIFVNIKATKYINERFSPRQGDFALRNYALQVRDFLGENGTVGRLGGDNFFIIVKKRIFEDTLKFLDGVSIRIPTIPVEKEIKVYVRSGIYVMRQSDDVRTMFNFASLAYNETRVPGAKDCYYFTEEMYERDKVKKQTIAAFKQSLMNREFRPFYQPKVSLETGEMVGAEALVRWIREDRIVSPAEFVPILEKDGSICELDYFMLEQVCLNLREWIDRGIEPVKVSVNLSRAHFANDELIDDIVSIMERYDTDRSLIEIEITESSCYEDYDKVLEFAEKIRKLGIMVSIDDFGTGFSSLSMLTNMNVDIIKLDKMFLDNVTANHGNDEILFRNIMNMIHDLGLTAVAEGVETKEQVEFLKDVRCNVVQGYYFDQPLFREVFEDRLIHRMNRDSQSRYHI